MTSSFAKALAARLSSKAALLTDEPLAPMTSFRIGGPAEYLLLPATVEDFAAGVRCAVESGIVWRMLGSGSNCIIPDAGLPGLTIKPWHHFGDVHCHSPRITAAAGADMLSLSREAAKESLSGVEWACGIPGTVGGAVYMNAGVKHDEICDTLESAKVLLENGDVTQWSNADFNFSYRTSRLQQERSIVLEATFLLEPKDQESIYIAMNEHLSMRSGSQPINMPNCGSVFRNPEGDFAGRLIESCGLKGYSHGGVMVSEQHANFIVNTGRGSAEDVLSLIQHIKQTVAAATGVSLQEEVRTLN